MDWIYTPDQIANAPSVKAGMSLEAEAKNRRDGVNIIWDVGFNLNLKPYPTLATAALYFHRFYMCHKFQEFQRELTSLGCLFLAGKVEETPKKCKDICKSALEKYPMLYKNRHRVLLEEIMGIERVLLQTLKFDLQVFLPYKYVPTFLKKLNLSDHDGKGIGRRAWTLINDSMRTTISISFDPQVVAVCMLFLAAKIGGEKKEEDQVVWWDDIIANLSVDLVNQICHKVLDFYDISKKEVGIPIEASNL
ncbi:unnamed protein product [Auanema sp. JU1783]|nr:unnamed protein product [Auanema sp. JU1783]